MSWISDNAIRNYGEEVLVDDKAPMKLTLDHIRTTIELDLKCAPISMTVVKQGGHRFEFLSKENMLYFFRHLTPSVIEDVVEIQLDYYTYREIYYPDEYKQVVMDGFIPI